MPYYRKNYHNTEIKYKENANFHSISPGVSTVASPGYWNFQRVVALAQGNQVDERQGRSVLAVQSHIRMKVTNSTTAPVPNPTIEIMLVRDTECDATGPVYGQSYFTTDDSSSQARPLLWTDAQAIGVKDRFKIVKKLPPFTLSAFGNKSPYTNTNDLTDTNIDEHQIRGYGPWYKDLDIKVPLDFHIKFKDGTDTLAGISMNGLYWCFRCIHPYHVPLGTAGWPDDQFTWNNGSTKPGFDIAHTPPRVSWQHTLYFVDD